MQHSHSRLLKTTSNLLTIHLKGKLMCGNGSPLEGDVHKPMVKKIRGHPKNVIFSSIFSKYGWFQTKWFTWLLEFIKLCKQKPLEIFFYFHYLPKLYILGLMVSGEQKAQFFYTCTNERANNHGVIGFCLLS